MTKASNGLSQKNWQFYQAPQTADEEEKKRKKPVIMLGSVKGGSGKTYCALSLAFTLTRLFIEQSKKENNLPTKPLFPPKVCVIDLDLSATNMMELVEILARSDNEKNLKLKKTVHGYIIKSTERTTLLEDYISRLTYAGENQEKYQIDLLLGSSDPKLMRLFSPNRISNYENAVSEPEARKLLHHMLDEVIRRNYDAIIIDMQPGMEGLCHSAIEYFTSAFGNEHHDNGIFSRELKALFDQYSTHLCMTSTSDYTQLSANVRWVSSQPSLLQKVENKHILIKDNNGFMEQNTGITAQSIYQDIVPALLKADDSKIRDAKLFESVAILRNNDRFVELFCKNKYLFINEKNGSAAHDIAEAFCRGISPYQYELSDWARRCLLMQDDKGEK